MKKFLYALVFAFAAVAFVACNDDDKSEPQAPQQPDSEPVQLATPKITVSEVTAQSITLSWEAVEHAGAYSYSIGTEKAATTTKLSVTLTELEPETTYSLRVKAVSNNLNLYTDSQWATESVTTLKAGGDNNDDNNDDNNNDNNDDNEKPEQPGSSAVQEGYYHIITSEYEDGSPYYNEFYVEHQEGNDYLIYNFFDYPDEIMLATYDAASSTLTLSGESLYEGEISQFFGYAWYYYDEEQTMSVGLFSFADMEDEESYGDDPFAIQIDQQGYLSTALGNILELVIDEESGESLGYISCILAGDEFTYGEYYTEAMSRSTKQHRVAAPTHRKPNLRTLKPLR